MNFTLTLSYASTLQCVLLLTNSDTQGECFHAVFQNRIFHSFVVFSKNNLLKNEEGNTRCSAVLESEELFSDVLPDDLKPKFRVRV